MKKANLSENNFEVSHVTKTLVDNGYVERLPDNYNQALFLDIEILLNFVKSTQPEEWEKLKEQYPGNTEEIFLKRVSSEIGKRGTLDVLRNGIKDRGAKFELAYFKPVSGLNPEHEKLYLYSRFLFKKLPLDNDTLPREIVENIDMDRYRIKQTYKGGITLEKKDGELAPLTTDEKKPPVSEFDRLSAIIAKINEIGGTQFAEDDKVKFARLGDKIYDNDHFKESMKTNTKSNLKLLFKKLFDKAMADMYESDLSFYKKIEENSSVKELIKDNLFEDVFRRGKEINL